MIKELEFLGHAGSGPLPARLEVLSRSHPQRHRGGDTDYRPAPSGPRTGEGTAAARDSDRWRKPNLSDEQRHQLREDLDDLFLCVQLYSYPGDYVAEEPTLERMAETLDKFEEDVLSQFSATVRGTRRATLLFGQPIAVERAASKKQSVSQITQLLEDAVQGLLDRLRGGR